MTPGTLFEGLCMYPRQGKELNNVESGDED
jgi:hypothetical protein